MRYSATSLSRARSIAVTLFIVIGLLAFAVLWVKSGGNIPAITGGGYKFNASFSNIDNLAHASDVDMVGVPVGTVEGLQVGKGNVMVNMVLHRNGPLHQGATVQIEEKTLIGESYVQVTDGHGPVLPSGTTLPASAAKNFTSLNMLFNAITPSDQQSARQLLTEFNSATTGQGNNINTLFADLANVGARGQTVFDVLAGQTTDLQQMVRQTGTLLSVLDEGQGQIGDLATSAEKVSRATASSSAALAQSVQELPGVITAARNASGSIASLSGALSPVAANLQAAAPTLNRALIVLPATTRSLRSILTPLNNALLSAPATLSPLPTTASALTGLLTPAANLLSNFNPIVGYLAPYNRDIAGFFANFNAAAQSHRDSNSYFGDVELIGTGFTNSGLHLPVPANLQQLYAALNANPIPAPGVAQSDPTQGPGLYPVIQREKY